MGTIVTQVLFGLLALVGLIGLAFYFKVRSKQDITENQKKSDYLKELFTKGKISQEDFDGITKIRLNDKKYGIIIGIVALLIIFAIVSAYAMYMISIIDCHQPLSHYPSSYNRFYNSKCGA